MKAVGNGMGKSSKLARISFPFARLPGWAAGWPWRGWGSGKPSGALAGREDGEPGVLVPLSFRQSFGRVPPSHPFLAIGRGIGDRHEGSKAANLGGLLRHALARSTQARKRACARRVPEPAPAVDFAEGVSVFAEDGGTSIYDSHFLPAFPPSRFNYVPNS